MKGDDKNPADWLRLVRRDQDRLARALAVPDLSLAWFHAQQAAEKALKAWLIGKGWALVKTHDLVFLVHECRRHGLALDWFLPSGIRLKILYIADRYVDTSPDPDSDATETQRLADDVATLIEHLFPDSTP
jgi:HEPN domain-containing protein